jgi:regulator of RNase E activity RraB
MNRKQVEEARQLLEILAERGEDFDDIRHVIHYFYGGNFVALGHALTELGYQVEPTVNDDGVTAERYEAIGDDWRKSTLVDLCDLADSYGVEYDGWEASMTRQRSATAPIPAPAPSSSEKSGWLKKLFGK